MAPPALTPSLSCIAGLVGAVAGACIIVLPSRADAADDAPGDATALMARYQCTGCHRIPGVPGASGTRGPPLQHMGLRSYIAGQLPNTPAVLQRWLVEPRALLPSTTMPAMGVTPADARRIAAYLHAQR